MDRRVTVEELTVTRDAGTGAEQRTWDAVDTVWAEVLESSTSAAEFVGDGVATYARPTKVRMRWRSDITRETHRLLVAGRILRIIGTAQIEGHWPGRA